MTRFVDMHMHAGFAPDPAAFAHELEDAGIAAFANTVSPGEFARLSPILGALSTMRLGVGLHPWWVGSTEPGALGDALEAFAIQLETTRFVGEIGLDFWPTHAHTRDAQIDALTSIACLCAGKDGALLSLHAVKAERELLDILEASGCLVNCTCILHSYGGSSDQLTRAIGDGCLFSVGKRMLSTKRGREYARILPADRLLIESDLPASTDRPASVDDVERDLAWVIEKLASIRTVEANRLRDEVNERGASLLGI